DQGRERQLHVGDSRNKAVHPPPNISGQESKRDTDRSLDHHGENAHGQGNARAVEDGAQQITALRVRAPKKTRIAASEPTRRKVGIEHIEAREIEGVLGRDERRCHRRHRDKCQKECCDDAFRSLEHERAERSISRSRSPHFHRRLSRLIRGSSQRLTTSASVLVTTKRNPTATRYMLITATS